MKTARKFYWTIVLSIGAAILAVPINRSALAQEDEETAEPGTIEGSHDRHCRHRVDVTGVWTDETPQPFGAQYFQDGRRVRYIYINDTFAHYFSGVFVERNRFEGIQLRRNRLDGCLTRMKVTFEVKSEDLLIEDWVALDSQCDLQEGQTGHHVVSRLL